MSPVALVTGASGFIGSFLTRRLVTEGWDVRAVDNLLRGSRGRLHDVAGAIDFREIDVRDEEAMTAAARGVDVVFHLAAVNGTENFYKRPELVLDVGIRGALAVVNACRRAEVGDLVVASSAEVYQDAETVPTPEDVALRLPDSLNPRYSYGGSKIATELIAFNYAREHLRKVQVFRPHNIYGPDMGWKHVIPQLVTRALRLVESGGPMQMEILGSGSATRAFCYVDDAVDGILTMYRRGEHRQIFHIGTSEEISVLRLAETIGELLGTQIDIIPSEEPSGSVMRRSPDVTRLQLLGYRPKVALRDGLARTMDWYREHPAPPQGQDLM